MLSRFGVRTVVCSPGTRNAPLLVAFNRNPELRCISVVDERSAAFIALGIASAKGEPVALCCTSGSALLNYAPAVSEAYYSGVPLIVISADRPAEWIDQADSQTIRQPGVLAAMTARTLSLSSSNPSSEEYSWFVNRELNNILLAATTPGKNRPVHINIHLGEPLDLQEDDSADVSPRIVKRMLLSAPAVQLQQMRAFARDVLAGRRVMIVCGFMPPDSVVGNALRKIARNGNIVIVAEYTANLRGCDAISNPDTLLTYASSRDLDSLCPDVVIYAGGSLISRQLKEFIRNSNAECYRIGLDEILTDTFCNLQGVFETSPEVFFKALASSMRNVSPETGFKSLWHTVARDADIASDNLMDTMPWSDPVAVRAILRSMPGSYNLQVSNGMPVRYVCGIPDLRCHRFSCNRGVSGIDGCTSTALGASLLTDRTTLLITGDMSAQYDIAALSSGLVTPRFKMVVMANGAGEIFHIIKATRHFAELPTLISPQVEVRWNKIADTYGMRYFEASSGEQLSAVLPSFIAEKDFPAMLCVITSSEDSASIYRTYLKSLKY